MMHRQLLALAFAIAALSQGCIPSLHPIYTENDLIFDKALVGQWKDQDPNSHRQWRFTSSNEESYRLVYGNSDGEQSVFHAHLARIQGTMFLDVQPEERELRADPFFESHVILGHSFLHVERIQPQLRLRAMDPTWLEQHLEKNPEAIACEKLNGDIVITASTQELQRFVLRHVTTEGAFMEASNFKR